MADQRGVLGADVGVAGDDLARDEQDVDGRPGVEVVSVWRWPAVVGFWCARPTAFLHYYGGGKREGEFGEST